MPAVRCGTGHDEMHFVVTTILHHYEAKLLYVRIAGSALRSRPRGSALLRHSERTVVDADHCHGLVLLAAGTPAAATAWIHASARWIGMPQSRIRPPQPE